MKVPGHESGSCPPTLTGLVEPLTLTNQPVSDILVARSLHHLDLSTGQIMIRLLNATDQPVHLKAGTTIAKIHLIQQDIESADISVTEVPVSTDIPVHIQPLIDAIPDTISPATREKTITLLIRFQHVFSKGPEDIGLTDKIEHTIRLKPGTRPIRLHPYRVGPFLQQKIDDEIDKLLGLGLIEESLSPWSVPIVMVSKPDNAKSMTVDYRKLNAVTEIEAYQLPRIGNSLDALSGASYFSTFNLGMDFGRSLSILEPRRLSPLFALISNHTSMAVPSL